MFNFSFTKITSILSTITGTVWQSKNSRTQLTNRDMLAVTVKWCSLDSVVHRTDISHVSRLVNTQFYMHEVFQIGGILAPNGKYFASNITDT